MTAASERPALTGIGDALRQSIEVPTDTYITDGFPLLLTQLSTLPAAQDPPPPVDQLR